MWRGVIFLPTASRRLGDIWSHTKGHGEHFLLPVSSSASFQPEPACGSENGDMHQTTAPSWWWRFKARHLPSASAGCGKDLGKWNHSIGCNCPAVQERRIQPKYFITVLFSALCVVTEIIINSSWVQSYKARESHYPWGTGELSHTETQRIILQTEHEAKTKKGY